VTSESNAGKKIEFTVTYRAVFVRYLQQGITEKAARQRAFSEVKGYLGKGTPSAVRLLSAPSGQSEQKANGQLSSVKSRVENLS